MGLPGDGFCSSLFCEQPLSLKIAQTGFFGSLSGSLSSFLQSGQTWPGRSGLTERSPCWWLTVASTESVFEPMFPWTGPQVGFASRSI
jgi:hypothetical protein